MVNKPQPPGSLKPDSARLTDPQPHTGWSWATTPRSEISTGLGVDIEVWLRARILEGYSDHQIVDMIADICDTSISEKSVGSWRLDLGYRRGARVNNGVHQGPKPLNGNRGIPKWAMVDVDEGPGPELDLGQ